MSIEEINQTADTSSKPAPLLQTLGNPDAAVCLDGFCAVPETDTKTTNTSGADK